MTISLVAGYAMLALYMLKLSLEDDEQENNEPYKIDQIEYREDYGSDGSHLYPDYAGGFYSNSSPNTGGGAPIYYYRPPPVSSVYIFGAPDCQTSAARPDWGCY
jgi:hypothetical protein